MISAGNIKPGMKIGVIAESRAARTDERFVLFLFCVRVGRMSIFCEIFVVLALHILSSPDRGHRGSLQRYVARFATESRSSVRGYFLRNNVHKGPMKETNYLNCSFLPSIVSYRKEFITEE